MRCTSENRSNHSQILTLTGVIFGKPALLFVTDIASRVWFGIAFPFLMREQPPPHYRTADGASAGSRVRGVAIWLLAATAAIVALTGAYFWGASNASVTQVEILIPTQAPAVVQIVGEVRMPGVYELKSQDRVLDAIEAAGGMTESAAIESINLAATVRDGSRIVVPAVTPTPAMIFDETPANQRSDEDSVPQRSVGDQSSSVLPEFPLDLNTATIEQLKSLPGIGDTRANQIVAFRGSVGGFSTLEQLLEISGIGTLTLEAIRPLVVIR